MCLPNMPGSCLKRVESGVTLSDKIMTSNLSADVCIVIYLIGKQAMKTTILLFFRYVGEIRKKL